jgi:hypothetical protein
MAKISNYSVTHFRGISDTVDVDLTDPRTGKPISLLLYGDNGSGKSSLVDALEFALRGRLSRRSADGKKVRREVQNLAVQGAPGVLVRLADGSSIRRGGGLAKSGVPEEKTVYPISGYQYSPIIIRRQDIDSFWRVPDTQRQAFFFDYLTDYHKDDVEASLDQLKHDLEDATVKRQRAAEILAKATGMAESALPRAGSGTRRFLQATLLPKYGKGNGPIRARRLPVRIYRPFLFYQTALQNEERIQEKLRHVADPIDPIERQLPEMLKAITDRVTADFIAVSKLAWISEVSIHVGENSELQITLLLENGRKVEPSQILSEAYLDLLALLILVEVHIECARLGQSQVIILDDVFQSVDSVNRIRALGHMMSRLSGWQVVITLHDRLWTELAIKAMQRANFAYAAREVLVGAFGQGPKIRTMPGRSADQLKNLVDKRESSEAISAAAGRVLEELCDSLSITLASSITRRPGDRYTIGDLWPGVASILGKRGTPAMGEAVKELAAFQDLRNMVGAHYNEFAASLSSRESLEFGQLTLNLWKAVRCATCGAYFGKYSSTTGRAPTYGFLCNCAAAHAETVAQTATPARESVD